MMKTYDRRQESKEVSLPNPSEVFCTEYEFLYQYNDRKVLVVQQKNNRGRRVLIPGYILASAANFNINGESTVDVEPVIDSVERENLETLLIHQTRVKGPFSFWDEID